jgi:biotin carboxyl carrier protein
MSDLSNSLRVLLGKFKATRFRALEIEDKNVTIRVRKKVAPAMAGGAFHDNGTAHLADRESGKSQDVVRKPSIPSVEAELVLEAQAVTPDAIRSPRVGHFFLTDKKLLKEAVLVEGQKISKGQLIGFIESMNVRYEVKSDKDGVLSALLVEDGEAVEYGQPLARFESVGTVGGEER